MGVYLNPGNIDFQKAVNSKIYVDKTELLAFTNSVLMTEQLYISVSRPRRFGKSMAANMLAAYYSRGCDSEELFGGLKIAEDADFKKHLNRYNVIRLNMQDFLTKAGSVGGMVELIEKKLFRELNREFREVDFDPDDFCFALEEIFAQTGIPFVFIIDEWDCVMRVYRDDKAAHTQYLDYLRHLLKDKSCVALAYMTGILPIKKYGQHSALNMFYEYSMMNAKPIQEFTGFTEAEVQALCEQYNVPYDRMKKWYDGYLVSGVSIYNPRSVVEAILRGEFDSYWTKTETYEALKVYIQMDRDGLREKTERLIAGERVSINPLKYQNDMAVFESADDVLALLIHLGYLTAQRELSEGGISGEEVSEKEVSGKEVSGKEVSGKEVSEKEVSGEEISEGKFPEIDGSSMDCAIPNSEVRQEFINCIEDGGWENVMDAIRGSNELLRLTIAGDEAAVANQIAKVHQENASILQYNDENSLSCAISLAYYSAKKSYTVVREMPAGKGFADLVFVPDRNCALPAMVVELKWDKSVKTALDQIRKNEYADCLKRFSGEILLVGVNYDKDSKEHTCRIERVRKYKHTGKGRAVNAFSDSPRI
ncbi:MAG: ATP-binding protein [Lachnospiraceae bacterium]|nr:ATP-binding protein [Lachnospiraceae bacterium]